MTRIAITGHMDLAPDSVAPIKDAIARELSYYNCDGLTGVSCIARGADSIFAEEVLAHGAELEVILPSSDYRKAKVKPEHAAQFDELMHRATHVRVMPFDTADRKAYEAANEALVTSCDTLFAVWDGQSGKKGGTALVVEYAESLGVPVRVIWPVGAARAA
jgi:hypothetical protein